MATKVIGKGKAKDVVLEDDDDITPSKSAKAKAKAKALADLDDEDEDRKVSKKASKPKPKGKPVDEDDEEDTETEAVETEDDDYEGPIVGKGDKNGKANKKDKAEPSTAPSTRAAGVTVETVESGVITFREGSGSQQMLELFVKHDGNKDKILAEAKAIQKAKKGFDTCDPEKKYKVIVGLVSKMKKDGYKLPKIK